MSQITLYLDDATRALVEQAAQEWPRDCLTLAGRFADFLLRKEAQPRNLPMCRAWVFDCQHAGCRQQSTSNKSRATVNRALTTVSKRVQA